MHYLISQLMPIRIATGLAILLAIAGATPSLAMEDPALIPDESIPIPRLKFDSKGGLVIRPSAGSSSHDFDYLIGNWKLKNRNLKSRLTHSSEWSTFESRMEMHQILNGIGNIDRYTDS